MEIEIKTLGWHDYGVPPSLQLFCNGDRFMFNCGENTNRFHLEHKLHLNRTRFIFLTHVTPQTVDGLTGVLLALEALHINEVNVVGPEPIKTFIAMIKSYITKLKDLKVTVMEINSREEFTIFPDVKLQCIPLHPVGSRGPQHKRLRCDASTNECKAFIDSREMRKDRCNYNVMYVLKTPETQGKFDVRAATELKIPKGKLYGLLKAGQSVTLEDGRVIQPHQVCGKPIPGSTTIVLCCLDTRSINETKNWIHQLQIKSDFVFHLTPNEILKSRDYQQLVSLLSSKDTNNILCNRSTEPLSFVPFMHSALLSNSLGYILPDIFSFDVTNIWKKPHPPIVMNEEGGNQSCAHQEASDSSDNRGCDEAIHYISSTPLSNTVLHPAAKRGLDTSGGMESCSASVFEESIYKSDEATILKEEYAKMKSRCGASQQFVGSSKYPKLSFLGTGGSQPSQYRNVSGILISLDISTSIIFDFGEGSVSQLYLMSSTWESFMQTILSVRLIFISHSHADHHLGLTNLLNSRHRLYPNETPPIVIAPRRLKEWLQRYNEFVVAIPHEFTSSELLTETGLSHYVLNDNKICIELFNVCHIEDSRGIKLSTSTDSIVYSGDTRPCKKLVEYATDCSVLIHEATFEDESQELAHQTNHSTIKEVLEIAKESKCQLLILTHFSQRYPKVPTVFSHPDGNAMGDEADSEELKMIMAFDCMELYIPELRILPATFKSLPPVIEKYFAQKDNSSFLNL